MCLCLYFKFIIIYSSVCFSCGIVGYSVEVVYMHWRKTHPTHFWAHFWWAVVTKMSALKTCFKLLKQK